MDKMKGWWIVSRSPVISAISGLLFVLFTFTLAACSDSAAGNGPADAGGEDAGGVDGSDEPPVQDGLREVTAATHFRTCTGCEGVSWCGLPPATSPVGLSACHIEKHHEPFTIERNSCNWRRLNSRLEPAGKQSGRLGLEGNGVTGQRCERNRGILFPGSTAACPIRHFNLSSGGTA